MEMFEFLATSNVFLSCCDVKLTERDDSILLAIDGCLEVESYIVHQEGFEFSLQPKNALIGLHVNVEGAENSFLLGVDVLNNVKRLHINGDANPVEEFVINGKHILLGIRAANLLEIEGEVGLELLHVELEIVS